MSSKMVLASSLQSGDRIKLSPRHRQEKWIREVILLDSSKGRIPKAHLGMILIVFWSCTQLLVKPDRQLFLVYSPKTQEKEVANG